MLKFSNRNGKEGKYMVELEKSLKKRAKKVDKRDKWFKDWLNGSGKTKVYIFPTKEN